LDREVVEQVSMHVALAVDYACSSKEIESLKNRMTEPTISVRSAEPERMPWAGSAERTLAMVERDYILQVLRQTGGKVAGVRGAAAKLGMKRTTLQSRMQKLKIQRSEYMSAGRDSTRRQAV
jgi:transcriptional regulator with GAF, ATPase, and Fis domain